MSFHNRGLNNGGGKREGEYNNDDGGAGGAGANKQQEFVSPSLCIPRTHANIRKERIFAVLRSLGLGWIGRIDVVEKTDEGGKPFIRVFIHFTKWFQNAQVRQFLEHLETQKSANIVYDEPWFWKVTKSYVTAPTPQQQQQQQQPSRFPRPRIDFDGASSRVQQEGQEQEQQQQVAATVSSKTPSSTSNSSGTNAVSGKGKEVAKRMGYESGKGLGKNADGRLVPVQIKKNIGRNGVGLGCAAAAVAAVAADASDVPSSEYWTKVAEAATTTTTRLSVSISPPKLERRLFCDQDDDGVASVPAKVASAPAKVSSHDVSAAAAAIWQASKSA
jgi:hypothetical protein